MVMGPTHAMSGAAAWLAGATVGLTFTGIGVNLNEPVTLALGTLITAGAALGPDIDSHSSTVVNSFGIFGRVTHSIVNAISVSVYNLTRTKYDSKRENGHRTLFHTGVMAVLMGLLVFFTGSISANSGMSIGEKELTWGQISTLIVFFIFFHLSLAGLFEKYFKKQKRKFGAYGMMLISAGVTLIIAAALPEHSNYNWLGVAVAAGWFLHLLGDLITKMGVPLLWPIPIRGHRWWDVTLPALFRIKADGAFEKIILLPALTIATVVMTVIAVFNMGDIELDSSPSVSPQSVEAPDGGMDDTGVVRPAD